MLQACVVRFHDAGGPAAQFTIQQPADVVRGHLAPMRPVCRRDGKGFLGAARSELQTVDHVVGVEGHGAPGGARRRVDLDDLDG